MVQRIEWVGEVRCRHLRPPLDFIDARPWIGCSFSGQRRQGIISFHHTWTFLARMEKTETAEFFWWWGVQEQTVIHLYTECRRWRIESEKSKVEN